MKLVDGALKQDVMISQENQTDDEMEMQQEKNKFKKDRDDLFGKNLNNDALMQQMVIDDIVDHAKTQN